MRRAGVTRRRRPVFEPWSPAAGGAVLALALAIPAAGQNPDPATAPIPVLDETVGVTPSLVVDLIFSTTNGPLVVDLVRATWSPQPAPGNNGDPPHFAVTVYDRSGAEVQSFDMWNPLWTFSRTDTGGERVEVTDLATAQIAFPLAGNLGLLRLHQIQFDDETDEETNRLLLEADLRPAIEAFCAVNAGHAQCAALSNTAPVADAGGPYLDAVDTPIVLDSSGSTDPDGDALTYAWVVDGGLLTDPGAASPMFTAAEAGIYRARIAVCDPGGLCDAAESSVVVYDPSGGFVTGGGWIESPPGACGPAAPDDACTAETAGRAIFGFVARYQRGAAVPDGQTEFAFQAGNLRLQSDTYDWLVVAGRDRAQFKGTGSINGVAGYEFMLTAYDGTETGAPDGFRIKIWTGTDLVYDNRAGAADELSQSNTQVIGGGSIVIRTR